MKGQDQNPFVENFISFCKENIMFSLRNNAVYNKIVAEYFYMLNILGIPCRVSSYAETEAEAGKFPLKVQLCQKRWLMVVSSDL